MSVGKGDEVIFGRYSGNDVNIERKEYKILGHFPPTPSDPVLRLIFPRVVRAADKSVIFRLYLAGLNFPEREVEFGKSGFPARRVRTDDAPELRRFGHRRARRSSARRFPVSDVRCPSGCDFFDQRVPLATRVAASGPSGVFRTAVGATINCFGFRTHVEVWRGLQFWNRV